MHPNEKKKKFTEKAKVKKIKVYLKVNTENPVLITEKRKHMSSEGTMT